ncbi:MAG: glutamine--tRNA ligase/YqeY domain fusion protein [Gammaproteobacteria bacterium]|nr:glutamine--tRNA ligase/YqeY domain fusion protein [Gammaproteobacteria bacterium]
MTDENKPLNFIQQIMSNDLKESVVNKIITRFPPEPNGYLHIGHAKSICLNFGLAEQFEGMCHLRFDDTNPEKENEEFVKSIIEDIEWLGFKWDGDIRYASDYFDQFYIWAKHLIMKNKAYVCELNSEEMKESRGTLTLPGTNSPYRDRSIDSSIQLLESMKTGNIEEGSMTLRAKIDMSSPNINLRDPVIYRIKRIPHHRAGDKWNIYPSYDFAHCLEDAIEGITHSVCTLEFSSNRPLYDWFIDNLPVPSKPRQFEFGRLNLNYSITSKRKLKLLVDAGFVDGWSDPRMLTISGLRRRGIPPIAIRNFCDSLAVAKTDGLVDLSQFEFFVRNELNKSASRAMVVINPLKVVITNLPENHSEDLSVPCHPELSLGERILPFTREIFIDESDFKKEYSKKFKKKLSLGKRVRLRNSYIVEADDYLENKKGEIIQVNVSLLPESLGEDPADGVKPKGVIHWVSADKCIDCNINLYERLFHEPIPDGNGRDFLETVEPESLKILTNCKAELSLAQAEVGKPYQFEREGYFCKDDQNSDLKKITFNQTIALRSNWLEHKD